MTLAAFISPSGRFLTTDPLTKEFQVFEGMEEKIQTLQNEVNSLQQRIIDLENQILVEKKNRNVLSEVPRIDLRSNLERHNNILLTKK